MKILKAPVFLLFFIFLSGCAQPQAEHCAVVFPDGFRIACEVAETPQEIQTGLMWRESLAADRGMLFVMPANSTTPFWMKNTRIPLDIIFMGEDYSIASISRAVPCTADPCPRYQPKSPYAFVLEANAGTAAAHNASEGTRLAVSIT
ncbi:MAG: DUF192 domain-containing protein [Candidatus Micrarchaeia archaeon]